MNTEQFKQIYYPFHEKLYRIAFRLLGDVENAEDVVQETYLKIWDKRLELEGIEQPEAFIIMILRNLCLNHIRWKKNKIAVSYDYNLPEDNSLITQIEVRDEAEKIRQLIDKLPEQQQQIITLRHCENYSYEEIGEITGLDINNIRVIVSRTRKVLRDQFEKIEKE